VGVVNIKFSQKEQAKFVLRTTMQRIFATGKTMQQTHKRTVGLAARAFASSPQPNPFDRNIKTSLEHGGSQHNFYKLPALADSRIRKSHQTPFSTVFNITNTPVYVFVLRLRVSSLFDSHPPGERCPQLRRLLREGVGHRDYPELDQVLAAGR